MIKNNTKYYLLVFLVCVSAMLSLLAADTFFVGANHMSVQTTSTFSNSNILTSAGDTYEANFGYLWQANRLDKISLYTGLMGPLYSNDRFTYPVFVGYVQSNYYFHLVHENFLFFGINFPYMNNSADPAASKYTWNGDLGYELGASHLWNNWLLSFGYKYLSGSLKNGTVSDAHIFSGWQISGFHLLP